MKLEYFHFLMVVEEYRSISAAARKLYMCQTTLSSIVKSAEDELGYAIFQRTPKGVVPTENGARLMELAREITSKYEEVMSLKSPENVTAYPLTMLFAPSLAVELPLELNRKLRETNFNCTLNFLETTRQGVISDIIQNKARLGVTYVFGEELAETVASAKKYKIKIEQLYSDEFYLVVNRRHRLAGRETVALNELFSERYACATNFSVGLSSAGEILISLSRNNISRTVFPSLDHIRKAVLHQDMIAILTGGLISCIIDPTLFNVIPLTGLDGPNELHVCLVRSNEQEMRGIEREAAAIVKNYYRHLETPKY